MLPDEIVKSGKDLRYDVVERGRIGVSLERDHQVSGGILRDIGIDLVVLELFLEVVAAPLELRLDRVFELDRHQQMGAALQIEPQLNLGPGHPGFKLIRQFEIGGRQEQHDGNHRQHRCEIEPAAAAAAGEMEIEERRYQRKEN